MSGGHFDYQQYGIQDIISDIEYLIASNDSQELSEWGDYPVGRGYSDKTIKRLQEAVERLQEAFVYAHRIDYLVSCDDGEETFHRRLEEELQMLEESKNARSLD